MVETVSVKTLITTTMKYSGVILLLLLSEVCVIYTRTRTEGTRLPFLRRIQRQLPPKNTKQPQYGENNKKSTYSHIVQTTTGEVRGTVEVTDRDQTQYASFVGIPYAQPPIDHLRFADPLPIEPWTEIKYSESDKRSCLEDEDCLVLNVFTPVMEPGPVSSPKAVIVFIHGGAFMGGDSGVDGASPEFFIDKDIIFVSLNYRLGPMGFLSLQNQEVPGNAGLKDQVLALKWIKANIDKFGGDLVRIVLVGHSAGSASVSHLQISPAAKGLFNAAIFQSGTAMQSWAFTEPDWAVEHAFRLGDAVGCITTDKQELLDCLRKVNPTELISAQMSALTPHELNILHFFPFIPTIEPPNEGAILTKYPFEYLSTGDFNHVPVILGLTSREALMVHPILTILDPLGVLQLAITQDLTRFVPYKLNVTKSSPEAPAIEQGMKDLYSNGEAMTIEYRENLMDLGTDSHFTCDIQHVTTLLAQNSRAPVWNYFFTYDGPFSDKNYTTYRDIEGVSHGGEAGYLLNPYNQRETYKQFPRDSRPHLMIDQMTEMWTNFAKYQDPTPNTEGYVKVKWEPFTTQSHNYLEIGNELIPSQGLLSERMKYWNDVYEVVDNRRPLPE